MWRDSDLISGDFDELLVAIMHVREHTSDVAFALDAIERGHPEEGGGSADEGHQEGEKRGEATGRMPHIAVSLGTNTSCFTNRAWSSVVQTRPPLFFVFF